MRTTISHSFTGSLKVTVYPRAQLTWSCPENYLNTFNICNLALADKEQKKRVPLIRHIWNENHYTGGHLFSCLMLQPIYRTASLIRDGSSSQGRLLLLARSNWYTLSSQHNILASSGIRSLLIQERKVWIKMFRPNRVSVTHRLVNLLLWKSKVQTTTRVFPPQNIHSQQSGHKKEKRWIWTKN